MSRRGLPEGTEMTDDEQSLKLKYPYLGVTDHALLRYLDRVYGFDVEHYRRCLHHEAKDAIRASATSVVVGDHKIILKGKLIVSVVPNEKRVAPKIRYKDVPKNTFSYEKNENDDGETAFQEPPKPRK